MTRLHMLGIFLAMTLTACTLAPDTYPVTGEECGPNDAVKGLDVPDCPAGV